MLLIANKPFVYAGRSVRKGDVFDARNQDVGPLLAVRAASQAPEQPRQKRKYRRRDMTAQDENTD